MPASHTLPPSVCPDRGILGLEDRWQAAHGAVRRSAASRLELLRTFLIGCVVARSQPLKLIIAEQDHVG